MTSDFATVAADGDSGIDRLPRRSAPRDAQPSIQWPPSALMVCPVT